MVDETMHGLMDIRRATQRWTRQLAPLVLWYATLSVLLIGGAAALDWHQHSGFDSSFVHLHPHVADHDHGDTGHDRPDDQAPRSKKDTGRGSEGILSLASGAASNSPPVAPDVPVIDEGRSFTHQPASPTSSADTPLPWMPRGPPV